MKNTRKIITFFLILFSSSPDFHLTTVRWRMFLNDFHRSRNIYLYRRRARPQGFGFFSHPFKHDLSIDAPEKSKQTAYVKCYTIIRRTCA